MRLVTFQGADGQHRAGALFNQDEAVLDLRIASQLVRGGDGAALTSVQALIEGGEAALAEAQSLLARTPSRMPSSVRSSCFISIQLCRPSFLYS